MKFDELFNSLTEAYPMAPNPNVPKQPNTPQPNNAQQQPQQQNQPQQGGANNIDPALVDELVKAQNPQAVLQILQQKLGVK